MAPRIIPGIFQTISVLMATSWFFGKCCNSDAALCLRPPVPEHGYFYPKMDSYAEGSSVEYNCRNRTFLSHSRNLTCLNSSKWDNEPPFCDPAGSPLSLFNGTYEGKGIWPANASVDGNYDTCMTNDKSWNIFRPFLLNRTIVAVIRLTTKTEKNSYKVMCQKTEGKLKQSPCDIKHDVNSTTKTYYCPNCTAEELLIMRIDDRIQDLCEVELFEYKEYLDSCRPLELLAADGSLIYNRTFASLKCDEGFMPRAEFVINCSVFNENNASRFYCKRNSMNVMAFVVPVVIVLIHGVIIAFAIWRWKRMKMLKMKRSESEESTSNAYPLEVQQEYSCVDFNNDYAKCPVNSAPAEVVSVGESIAKTALCKENSDNVTLTECEVYADYSSCSLPDNSVECQKENETNARNSCGYGSLYSEIP